MLKLIKLKLKEISFAEWVIIAITLTGLVGTFTSWIIKQCKINYPFKTSISVDKIIDYKNSLDLKGTETKLWLKVKCRISTNLSMIRISLTEKEITTRPADVNTVSITNIDHPWIKDYSELTSWRFKSERDEDGSIWGYYDPTFQCQEDQPFRLLLNIHSKKNWEGNLRFEHIQGGEMRTFTLNPIQIKPDPILKPEK